MEAADHSFKIMYSCELLHVVVKVFQDPEL